MPTILIVDDDEGFRALMDTILQGEGYETEIAASVAGALAAGARRSFNLVVTDLNLTDGSGLDVLRYWKQEMPDIPVVVITGFGTVSSAVEAMKMGAVDYLGKPLSSPDELRLVVRKALDHKQAERELDLFREQANARFSCSDLIASDPAMLRVVELVRKVAPTQATVLISGESGTGKEVIARCIHRNSSRRDRVFVPLNCAALSPTLIESELFGHERGAFTGAVGQHAGRFERAAGGTLFLDEIGELDAGLQAKLLRVLQERTFERVGGTRQVTADVRILAATNRNLKQSVAEGKFREDLYYRLNTFPIEIPPLRDRPSDIRRLARFFLDRAAGELNKGGLSISPEAETVLMSYSWPGNVRELQNTMERVAILSDGIVEPDDLPVTSAGPTRPVLFKDIERSAIEQALAENHGNRTRAAKQLGISLRTLQYRLKEYNLQSEP
jgi:two-component system, NtrC family, response regulator AtoC